MKSIPAGDRADHGFAHQTGVKAADTERDRLVHEVHHRDAPSLWVVPLDYRTLE